MNAAAQRRENFEYLVDIIYDRQKDLAERLVGTSITPWKISRIRNNKRPFKPHEARTMENKLGIPDTWMDRFALRESPALELMRKFGKLNAETQKLVNEILAFSEGRDVAK